MNYLLNYDELFALMNKIRVDNETEYKKFITDKDIPLEKRWNTFKNAPYNWKYHDSYLVHFAIERIINRKITWYDDFYIERHQTVDMCDVIEYIQESDRPICVDLAAHIDEFKEEILSINLGSFIYDW